VTTPRPGIRAIRIVKGDKIFHVHGDQAGAEGVYLAANQVENLYDAPIKTTYKTGAFQVGSTFRYAKHLERDLNLGFHVKETRALYEFNDSEFRRMFAYEPDQWDAEGSPTTIEVETDLSGIRKLDVLMYEQPQFTPEIDPLTQEYGNVIFRLRAGQPNWYEDDIIDTFTGGASSGSGSVTVENPTDLTMYHQWTLTPATWTLPDFSWTGGPGERAPGGTDSARTISGIAITDTNGGAVVDLDRSALMYRDMNDTNLQAQLGPVRIFNYPIPPYTPETSLPVLYEGASSGATVELVMKRRWTRPWGLELLADPNAIYQGMRTTFTKPGSYFYVIPDWCDAVDYVLVGGGGGGQHGLVGVGKGGLGGVFDHGTLTRAQMPTDAILWGTVGAGGARGTVIGADATSGTASTMSGTGISTHTAAGGAGGGSTNMMPENSADLEYHGRTYPGGGFGRLGAAGTIPSGGGAGGFPLGPGFPGARGQIWFFAYQEGC
jgi:hypothetical protein